jgi:dUTP pyrophosphatase
MRQLEIAVLDPKIKEYLPSYGSESAAGLDLRACLEDGLTLLPDDCVLVPTGIAIHLADPCLCGLIFPRSGLGHKHGIVLGNGVGVIDADYQGEIKISLWNRSKEKFFLKPLDRVAQLVIMPIEKVALTLVEKFQPSQRGKSGFGSTGVE